MLSKRFLLDILSCCFLVLLFLNSLPLTHTLTSHSLTQLCFLSKPLPITENTNNISVQLFRFVHDNKGSTKPTPKHINYGKERQGV